MINNLPKVCQNQIFVSSLGQKEGSCANILFFFWFLLKEQTTASMCESDSETDCHTGTIGGLCFEENNLARACASLARAVVNLRCERVGCSTEDILFPLACCSFSSLSFLSHLSCFTCALWTVFMEKILITVVMLLVLF